MAYPGTRRLGLVLLIPAFLMLSPAAGAGQYYRWVDENGVTQFSDSPPDENMRPREIPESNSAMPIRRNNSVKRQKLAPVRESEPEKPTYEERRAQEEREREERRQRARCKDYKERMDSIDSRLRAGGYSNSYGNRLRRERSELYSTWAKECMRN